MKELETNEGKQVLTLWKRVVIIVVTIIIIIPIMIFIFSIETSPLVLLAVPLFMILMFILFWVINPYGECRYLANKIVIKKDRFIIFLENGDISYFPFSRIVEVKCVGKFPHLTIILERGILSIQLHLTIYGENYVDNTYVTKMVARRLNAAVEKYKNNSENVI